MTKPYQCSDPLHEGDPTRVHFNDRLEKRIEFRRLSDYGRERVFRVADVCKSCMRREYGTAAVPQQQESIFS